MTAQLELQNEIIATTRRYAVGNGLKFATLVGVAVSIALQDRTADQVAAMLRHAATLEEHRLEPTGRPH